jgi:hypothetical protein
MALQANPENNGMMIALGQSGTLPRILLKVTAALYYLRSGGKIFYQ